MNNFTNQFSIDSLAAKLTNRKQNHKYFNVKAYSLTIFLCLSTSTVMALPILHNDENNTALEALHIDEATPHYEYEEKLERGKIKQEVEYEINEILDIEEKILEQKLEVHNSTGIDTNPRTNFFSNDDHDNLIDIFANSNEFSYIHQLPPSISPDVNSGPIYFNDFDFRTDLLEIELEIEGWTNGNPNDSTFEVRITDGIIDIATLGLIEFDTLTSDGLYEFEFEFEQYNSDDYADVFISDEIYSALSDGLFEINIVRTSGFGQLFLEESELELEKIASVPEPSVLFLLGSGLLGVFGLRKRQSLACK